MSAVSCELCSWPPGSGWPGDSRRTPGRSSPCQAWAAAPLSMATSASGRTVLSPPVSSRPPAPAAAPPPQPGLPQTSSTLRRSPSSSTPVAPGACPRAEQDPHGSLDAPAFQAFLPRAGPSDPCSPVSRAHHTHPALQPCSSLLPLPARPCPACPRPGHLGPGGTAATKLGLQDSPAGNRVFLQLRGGHSPSTVSGKGPCLGSPQKQLCSPGDGARLRVRSAAQPGLGLPHGSPRA